MPAKRRWGAALNLALGVMTAPAAALDYQLHGFISQGYALSEGNNVLGSSTNGSSEFYEAGLTGALAARPDLLLSAQILRRDAGAYDDGSLRLDFAFADYRYDADSEFSAGLRAGRVKNAFGFFNDARDVVFTRPGILLPARYFDSSGNRQFFFSSDGVQLYASVMRGDHQLSALASGALDDGLAENEERLMLGDLAAGGDLESRNFHLLRLGDTAQFDNGLWDFAFSYLHGELAFDPDPGVSVAFDFDFDLYLVSARHNAARYVLTAEYGVTAFQGSGSFGEFDSMSDGVYVQGDYLFDPQWTLMARLDSSFTDRNDRGGSHCRSGDTPVARSRCYAHDLTLGAQWQHDEHWGLWGEIHAIRGSANVPARDNPGRTPDGQWALLLLMAAYRF